jgi:hypothetical protein
MRAKYRRTASGIALVALISLTGCATQQTSTTGTGTPATPTTSTVTAFLTDAPAPGVVAFRVDVTSASLEDSNGAITNLASGTQQVEFRHLELAPTLGFRVGSTATGNFTTLNMAFANPQVTLTDAQGNITILNSNTTPSARLTTAALNQPINASFQPTSIAGLMIDLDLKRSVQIDSRGNYLITPMADLSVMEASQNECSLENAQATVVSSSPASGVVKLQLRDTGQTLAVATGVSTAFAADSGEFSSLQAGQSVEVTAHLQSDGSFMADRIDAISSSSQTSFRGVVTGVSQDSAGKMSLTLVAQE